MTSDVSFMLESALEQMDNIIAGSKAVVSADDVNSPAAQHASPVCPAHPSVLQLAEQLTFALEGQMCPEDKETLRRQMSSATAHTLLLWLDRRSEISRRRHGGPQGARPPRSLWPLALGPSPEKPLNTALVNKREQREENTFRNKKKNGLAREKRVEEEEEREGEKRGQLAEVKPDITDRCSKPDAQEPKPKAKLRRKTEKKRKDS
ncbi:hypothetical protein QQF64_011730 [Cirrhinus molitorella]|uniref:Uncharacterized protein n=1 Tax=Cirrhinus molitorella TaxID=172907 RepID=A0ABR3LUM2_9TELE